MKKHWNILLIIDILVAIIFGSIGFFYKETLSKFLIDFFIGICSLTSIIGVCGIIKSMFTVLSKKKNIKKIAIYSTVQYFVISILYALVIYFNFGNNIFQIIIMLLFYISLLLLLLLLASIFYYLIKKNKVKSIIKLLFINLVIIGICLIISLIANHVSINTLFLMEVNFVYIANVLLLTFFLIIFIIVKLVLLNEK